MYFNCKQGTLIPQNKIKSNLKFQKSNTKYLKNIYANIEHVWAFEQKQISSFENNTPEYSIFNISLGLEKKIKTFDIDFNLKVNNLLNIAYYDHLSTLKNLGFYNMGRNINLGIRIRY